MGIGDYSNSDWAPPTPLSVTTDSISPPPVTPDGLTNTGRTTDSVTLEWDAVGNASGYEIQYRKTGEPSFRQWMGNPVTGTLATIEGLTANTTYEFQVRAVNDDGESDWSETFIVTMEEIDDTPFDITATENSATIAWTEESLPAGTSGFQYKESASGTWVTWATSTAPDSNVTFLGLKASTSYDFRFVDAAGNQVGEVMQKATVAASGTQATNPVKPKPSMVKKGTNAPTITSVTLTWDALPKKATAESNVVYLITCTSHTDIAPVAVSGTGKLSHTFTGLHPGKTYKFTVTAVNADGKAVDIKGKDTTVKVTAKTPKYVAPKMKADTKGIIVTGGEAFGKTKTSIDSITLTWATAGRPVGENFVVKVFDVKTKQEVTANLEYSTGADKKGNTLTTLTFTGLKATTKYRVEVQAYTGESFDTATHKSSIGKISISTLKYPDAKFKQASFSPTEIVLNVTLPKKPIAGAYDAFQFFDSNGTLVATASGDAVAEGMVTFTEEGLLAGKYTVKAVILDELGDVLQSSVKGTKIIVKAV